MESILLPAVIILFILEVALFAGIVFREVIHYRQKLKVEKKPESAKSADKKK